MELTIEQAVIAFLFTTLSSFVGVVMKALWTENKELKEQATTMTKTMSDLVAVQAEALRGKGVQIVTTPPPDP